MVRLIRSEIPCLSVLPYSENDLCNTIYIEILAPNCRADDLAVGLDLEGLLVSTGSACSSGRQDVSHVPMAMGYTKEEARKFFRISLDWDAKEEELVAGCRVLKKVLEQFSGEGNGSGN